MADPAVTDVSKMKVVDLRKALKSRGLTHSGDKAELIARLQAAISQDTLDGSGDINLDSDEIDLDGVLDEDDKGQSEVNDAIDDEELALSDQPVSGHDVDSSCVAGKASKDKSMAVDQQKEQTAADQAPTQQSSSADLTGTQQGAAIQLQNAGEKTNEPRSIKTMKRKISMSDTTKKVTENNKDGSKKIVLNRAISATSVVTDQSTEKTENKTDKSEASGDNNKVKITADLDAKTRLEMRAKRFGLPVKMADDQKIEIRKQRFEQNAKTATITDTSGNLNDNIDKLKQRAERFGQSVSKFMTDIDNKEKLEKRKAKFANLK